MRGLKKKGKAKAGGQPNTSGFRRHDYHVQQYLEILPESMVLCSSLKLSGDLSSIPTHHVVDTSDSTLVRAAWKSGVFDSAKLQNWAN